MDETRFTDLLTAWSRGDRAAEEALYGEIYGELRGIARQVLRSQGRGDQLSTTLLVNECYLKLAGSGAHAGSRQHFLALCARAMRQLIVDSARRALAEKRGNGEVYALTLQDVGGPQALRPESVAALDQALSALDARDPRLARIAECRIFAGMDTADIAHAFGLTERSVQREWKRVHALLTLALEVQDG
jgi:RNA polymerase sigma factor (TIGR02999 family)